MNDHDIALIELGTITEDTLGDGKYEIETDGLTEMPGLSAE